MKVEVAGSEERGVAWVVDWAAALAAVAAAAVAAVAVAVVARATGAAETD